MSALCQKRTHALQQKCPRNTILWRGGVHVVHADQIPFMAMSSRERSQCATSFKGRLVTYIADVRVMSALAPKADIAQLEEHVRFVGRLRAKTNGLVAARPDAYLANIAAE